MDVSDALDAYIQAQLQVGEWQDDFLSTFYKPVLDTIVGEALRNAGNPEVFDQSKVRQGLSPSALSLIGGK